MIIYNQKLNAYNFLTDFINTNKYSSIVILCDTNTKKYCLNNLYDEININPDIINVIEINDGEQVKTIETSKYIWDKLLEIGCDRKSLLINLGGGVVSDIGGFVASVFKRGISFINIPTTLLSMVDAGIGGKTGVDFGGVKNIIGTITLPKMTIIDIRYLETLNERETVNGYAEILKHALIKDKNHWEDLLNCDPFNLNYSQIIHSINIKQKIVEEDINEQGIRKILNFGHSIGHAIEAFFLKGNKNSIIKHGEAVAAGMIMESYISMQLGLLNSNDFEEIKDNIIKIYGLIEIKSSTFHNILEFLINDKKNRNNIFYFVLLDGIGNATFNVEVKNPLVLDALGYYSKLNIN